MQPKDVVRRFVNEYQTGADERAFDELLHADVVDHSRPPGIAPGAEGVRQQFDGFRAAFPDFRATILDQVAEGDKVVTRKVFMGTHVGAFQGLEPTGREVKIDVIDIVRIADGKIVGTGTALTGSASSRSSARSPRCQPIRPDRPQGPRQAPIRAGDRGRSRSSSVAEAAEQVVRGGGAGLALALLALLALPVARLVEDDPHRGADTAVLRLGQLVA